MEPKSGLAFAEVFQKSEGRERATKKEDTVLPQRTTCRQKTME
jgi:hypothetical protein